VRFVGSSLCDHCAPRDHEHCILKFDWTMVVVYEAIGDSIQVSFRRQLLVFVTWHDSWKQLVESNCYIFCLVSLVYTQTASSVIQQKATPALQYWYPCMIIEAPRWDAKLEEYRSGFLPSKNTEFSLASPDPGQQRDICTHWWFLVWHIALFRSVKKEYESKVVHST